MSMTIAGLVMVLAVWMVACVWCGYRVRFLAYLGVLLLGLALNMAWMVFGLDASPFEAHALMAEAAVMMYGLAAFGVGWLAGRLARQWRETRIE